MPFLDPGSLPLAYLYQHALLARVQVVLLLFLVVGSVLVGLFLGYHLLLARGNMTSNESYKWRDYKQRCLEAAVLDRWVSSNVGTWHILNGCTAPPGDRAPVNSCAASLCQLLQLLVMCDQMLGSLPPWHSSAWHLACAPRCRPVANAAETSCTEAPFACSTCDMKQQAGICFRHTLSAVVGSQCTVWMCWLGFVSRHITECLAA